MQKHIITEGRNPNQGLAAIGNGDLDPLGARIDRVLDQFLHRGGRPLDHLARRNTVGGGLGKTPNSCWFTHHVAVLIIHDTKPSMTADDSGRLTSSAKAPLDDGGFTAGNPADHRPRMPGTLRVRIARRRVGGSGWRVGLAEGAPLERPLVHP